ncbi:alpha/beta fold hydrolase [Thalassotalea euphylliae]|uniref:Alpha/beta fold hydrolase n=1 Tax=Thalassotalea euphylliae TaxID=1655234 RepID=A0A3E0TV39_9GAMM|nr:alpha/beta fold hydrolase [Thalassotalea euphylliae]REL28546.1 alpha/beta fold hydrolase [Thalassotalea euphylliae]
MLLFSAELRTIVQASQDINNNMKDLLAGLLAISMTLTTTQASAASTPWSTTSEQALPTRYDNEIKSFWQTGQFSEFSGVDDVSIRYAQFLSPSRNKCLLLVPGRSESYLKYQELAFDLTNAGYNLFIIDHRGQGLSGRMQSDEHKGYVAEFDHYSDDLHFFVDNIVQPQCQQDIFLLAHSMGGAISARYLQRYQTPIKAAVLASPMIAVNSGGIPSWLGEFIIGSGDTLSQWFSDDSWYFLGQSGYSSTPFADNALMQSPVRYEIFTHLYQSTPDLQLGGVTFRWLSEAVQVNKDIFSDIHKLTVPTIVLQAGSDTVVDNQAQNDFCQALHAAHPQSCPEGKPAVIAGARHEIFFELDKYRIDGIVQTLNWFQQASK